jgi:hypothetical protein
MPLLSDIHERKASVKTLIIMSLLIISFFFWGMSYMDPPIEIGVEVVLNEGGAEVNYGTSDTGSGEIQPMTTNTPQNVSNNAEPEPKTSEATLTQETEEAPVINPKPKTKPTETKPKVVTPKPDKSTNDALNNILGAPSNTNQSSNGHGDDSNGSGDKGQIDGNPYATAFYGNGSGNGSGTGTGYGMNGRSKTSNQKFSPDCNEEGRVVVQIEVDRTGKVIKAVPGVKGTTNSATCLLEPAKKTALSYKFNPDSKAPTKQIGFVVINFTLGE